MAVNPPAPGTLDFQAFYFPPGAAIKFPLISQIAPFTPNAISINNRTALNLQFGPTSQGPFIPAGSYTLNIYPWTYGPSLFVTSLSGILQVTDFLDVHFLSVNTPGGVGVPQITASAPAGWGPVGPGNTLANVNAGDPFNFGQVQQLINLLTGVMSGQAVVFDNSVTSMGPAAGFLFADRDGVGGDYFEWYTNAGLARLFSSVLSGDTITVDETANFTGPKRITSPATGASAKPLLNWVPLNTPTGSGTTGTGSTALTLISIATDVPASAKAVAFTVVFSSTVTSDVAGIFNANPVTNAQAGVHAINVYGSAVLGLPTAQTLWFTVTGTGAWNLTIFPTFYAEPS